MCAWRHAHSPFDPLQFNEPASLDDLLADPGPRKRAALGTVDPNTRRSVGGSKRHRKSVGRRVSFATNMQEIREVASAP